jgi:toxin HigB-1
VIQSFADSETKKIWNGEFSKKLPPEIQSLARRKLRMINNAAELNDLKQPPGNQLEQLKSDRKGQYSIRINKK